MKHERVDGLVKELKEWCAIQWGSQAEVAKYIGTSRATISHWFAKRQRPTGEQALLLEDFLKKKRRQSSKSAPKKAPEQKPSDAADPETAIKLLKARKSKQGP